VALQVAENLTGAELLAWRRTMLAEGGEAASFDWLLDLAAGLSVSARQHLWLDPERSVVMRCSCEHLAGLWRRHLREHTPLQYLVRLCPWRDLELQVAPGVLIPRQETEQLVDLALELMAQQVPDSPAHLLRWADLGTGSGCLAVALARALPTSAGVAVDCSSAALLQARANLLAAGVADRVDLQLGSWWSPTAACCGAFDLVVSNPPYIPSSLLDSLDPVVRLHEPWLALDGGEDGLDALRLIAAGAASGLAPGGWLLLEHHYDQSERVQALLAGAGLEQVASFADFQGHGRFSCGRRPQPARSSPQVSRAVSPCR